MTNTERAKLEKEFRDAMHGIYKRCVDEINYKPTAFLDMLHKHGAIETAKRLVMARHPSTGYTRLFEERRLDLTIEAVLVENPQFHSLFGDDKEEIVEKATKRLHDYGYKPKVSA